MTSEKLTYYFEEEGRKAMEECIHHAAEWCVKEQLETIVMFTGTGAGPHYAARELLLRDRYRSLRIVAVTPPFGRVYKQNPADPSSTFVRSGINPAMREELIALGIGVVSAHLPFKEIHDGTARTSEWTRVAEAYGVLGGGFALCVQAALMACDAGLVQHGERVVVLSADSAFAARASRTESFLSPYDGLLVEHVICRPARYNISKRLHETIVPREEFSIAPELSQASSERALPAPILTTGTEVARGESAPELDEPPSATRRPRKRSRPKPGTK